MQYNCSKKMFNRKAKPIRITSFRISGVLLRVPNKLINYSRLIKSTFFVTRVSQLSVIPPTDNREYTVFTKFDTRCC